MITIMLNALWKMMDDLPWRQDCLRQGQALFRRKDQVERMFRVDEGEIHLVRYQKSGQTLALQRANRHAVVADASLFAAEYHCDAVAHLDTVASSVRVNEFRDLLSTNSQASQLWMIHLGRTAQDARFRAEMISLRTVDERLDAWVDWHQTDLPKKGQWRSLAEELGISPEALYRSLAKRR